MSNAFGISERLARLEDGHKRIISSLNFIIKKLLTMDQTFAQLQTEITNNTSVEQSAVLLIQGLAAQIKAAGTDPAALEAIVTQLQSNDSALAAAVAANTPATVNS